MTRKRMIQLASQASATMVVVVMHSRLIAISGRSCSSGDSNDSAGFVHGRLIVGGKSVTTIAATASEHDPKTTRRTHAAREGRELRPYPSPKLCRAGS